MQPATVLIPDLNVQLEILSALGPTLFEALDDAIVAQLGFDLSGVSGWPTASDLELEAQLLDQANTGDLSPSALEVLRAYVHRVVEEN